MGMPPLPPMPRATRARGRRLAPLPGVDRALDGPTAIRYGAGVRAMRANVARDMGLGPDVRVEAGTGERQRPIRMSHRLKLYGYLNTFSRLKHEEEERLKANPITGVRPWGK